MDRGILHPSSVVDTVGHHVVACESVHPPQFCGIPLNTGVYGFSFSVPCILLEDDEDRSNVGVYDTCRSDNG